MPYKYPWKQTIFFCRQFNTYNAFDLRKDHLEQVHSEGILLSRARR